MAASGSSNANAGPKLTLPPCGFVVSSGKKGNVPISIEKRPKGKKVTVISNVQGSAKCLLSTLSSLLGSGGTVRQEVSGIHWTVEVQGDQTERITGVLTQLGCLRGVKKAVEEKEKKKKEDEVATRVCGYDKFLRKGAPDRKDPALESFKASLMEAQYGILPDADCAKWHGPWFYCRGRCVRNDVDDVWEENLQRQDDGNCQSSSSSGPPAPTSEADVNYALRNLGLLAEVGGAHRLQRMALPTTGRSSMTIDEYRKAAMAPGSRLITEDSRKLTSKEATAARRAAASSRSLGPSQPNKHTRPSRAPPPRAPPKEPPKAGRFGCPVCASVFGLHSTLKLHIRNAHPGASCPSVSSRAPAGPVKRFESIPLAAFLPSGPTGRQSEPAGPTWDRPASEVSRGNSAPSPGWKLSEAFPKGPPDVSNAKDARSTNAASRSSTGSRGGGVTGFAVCRVCGEFFEKSHIEVHEAECADAAAAAYSESSDEEPADVFVREAPVPPTQALPPLRAGGLCRVTKDFVPGEGEMLEVQLCVREGDKVKLQWLQEPEFGSYWAYVSTIPRTNADIQCQWGYVPAEVLMKAEDMASPILAPKQAPEPVPVQLEVDGALPSYWLESFLMLDLAEDRAELFWARFEVLRKALSLENAWVTAMEEMNAGSWDSWETSVDTVNAGDNSDVWETWDDSSFFKKAETRSNGTSPGAQNGRDNRDTMESNQWEAWVQKNRDQKADRDQKSLAKKPESSAPTREVGQRKASMGKPESREQPAGREEPASSKKLAMQPMTKAKKPESSLLADDVDRRKVTQHAAHLDETSKERQEHADGEEMVVTADFSGDGSDQLHVRQSERVLVTWKQAKEDGGYWVWAHLINHPDVVGYVPLSCLCLADPDTGASCAPACVPAGKFADNKQRNKISAAGPAAVPADKFADTTVKEQRNKIRVAGPAAMLADKFGDATVKEKRNKIRAADVLNGWCNDDAGGKEAQATAGLQAAVATTTPGSKLAEIGSIGGSAGGRWAKNRTTIGDGEPSGGAASVAARKKPSAAELACEKQEQSLLKQDSWLQSTFGSKEISGPPSGKTNKISKATQLQSDSHMEKSAALEISGPPSGKANKMSKATQLQTDSGMEKSHGTDLVPCPLCGNSFSMEAIVNHADKCVGKDLVELQPSAAAASCSAKQAQLRAGVIEVGLNEADTKWAEAKMAALCSRYCVSHMDVSVALAQLSICSSSYEMREEAVMLMFDNAPVRNFADELWRRTQSGVQPRRC